MLALPRRQLRSVWAQGGTLDRLPDLRRFRPSAKGAARNPVYGPVQPFAGDLRVVEASGDRRQDPRHGTGGADARTGLGLSRAPEAILAAPDGVPSQGLP
jgi:hypothetical protein